MLCETTRWLGWVGLGCTHDSIRKDGFNHVAVQLGMWWAHSWQFHLCRSAIGLIRARLMWGLVHCTCYGRSTRPWSFRAGNWVFASIRNEALIWSYTWRFKTQFWINNMLYYYYLFFSKPRVSSSSTGIMIHGATSHIRFNCCILKTCCGIACTIA